MEPIQLICHDCTKLINLPWSTYYNYKGPIRCPSCKSRMDVEIVTGELRKSIPLDTIKPEFVSGLHNGIPEQPRNDYLEAVTCHTYHAYKASAVLARCSIQGALLVKGVPDDTPMKMIQWALSHNLLKPKQAHLATTVTFFGGKGAHPQDSELNSVGELEATQGLLVTKELLIALFPSPS